MCACEDGEGCALVRAGGMCACEDGEGYAFRVGRDVCEGC
jgi:hypothetical protein